jgi:hypothetical protein
MLLTCSPSCPHLQVGPVHIVVRIGPVCKFVWCEPVQSCVRSVLVVVVLPCFNNVLGVAVTVEDVFDQALVTQTTVE